MTDSFDRTRPLYRLFLEDTPSGGPEWYVINADTRPGRRCPGTVEHILNEFVAGASWGEAFEAASAKHRKATIYYGVDFAQDLIQRLLKYDEEWPPYFLMFPADPPSRHAPARQPTRDLNGLAEILEASLVTYETNVAGVDSLHLCGAGATYNDLTDVIGLGADQGFYDIHLHGAELYDALKAFFKAQP